MKYHVTILFEGSTEDLATFAFQNAVEKVAHADGIKFREAQILTVGAGVEVEAIQTLRPEDFSNWEGRRKANEETEAYARLLQRLSSKKVSSVTSRSSVAAKVRQHKEKHPELYCPKCLWRTGGGPCPRHGGNTMTIALNRAGEKQ